MFLLEHDAKRLLAGYGVPVPPGVWTGPRGEPDTCGSDAWPPGACIVKAQVTGGGRGRAGGVRRAQTPAQAVAEMMSISGEETRLSDGRRIEGFRVEAAVDGAIEAYFALVIDAPSGRVRVILSAQGGVEVEEATAGQVVHEMSALDADAIVAAAEVAVQRLPALLDPQADAQVKTALVRAARPLVDAFLSLEAHLIEVNPLFVRPDGGWLAGDAKVVTDDSSLGRQAELQALLERSAARYPDVERKWRHGCDYVVVDPQGEIGLLTTGAGLSMMLIDELRSQGLRPYNFLDVRTGGLRGDPRRLIEVLQWMTAGTRLRVLLVNIFAGITDLAEFAGLLGRALDAVPALRVPVVARLVGPGLDAARAQLAIRGIGVETDLERAVDRVRALLVPHRA